MRLVTGFAIQPFVAAAVVFAIFPVITRSRVLVIGAILSNLPMALVVLLVLINPSSADLSRVRLVGLAFAVALGSFVGVVCASTFWLIAGRHLGTRSSEAAE